MNIEMPMYYRRKLSTGNPAFPKEGVWKISVPGVDSFEWSVVLSCLAYIKQEKKLFFRLLHFAAWNKNNGIPLVIFNPFENRFLCHKNRYLKHIVKKFKAIEKYKSAKSIYDKVKAASIILKCSILCFTDRSIYSAALHAFDSEIILFYSERNDRFCFGLRESRCLDMRERALKYILRSNIKDETLLTRICSTLKTKKEFLISILKSEARGIISDLYQCPYLITQLMEAGYLADPKIKDRNGFSAFYHAVNIRDSELCLVLFNFAINDPSGKNKSYRYQNSEALNNMKSLEKILEEDLSKLKRIQHCDEEILVSFNTLLSVTKFIIEIIKKIVEIEKENPFDSIQDNDEIQNVAKRCNVIVSILKTYLEHFNAPIINGANVDASRLEDYIIYKYYYDMVDLTTSLMFFDNIHRLKEKLSLPKEIDYDYEIIESAEFLSVLNCITFSKFRKCKYFPELPSEMGNKTHEVTSKIRRRIHDQIKLFLSVLNSIDITESNIRNNVHKDEYSVMLDSHPEIKNYLLIERLQSYIGCDIEVYNTKGPFVIERVLQVLGEFVKFTPENDYCIKWFLSLYMPKNTRKILHRLRDKLTHLHNYSDILTYESNPCKFKGIQEDIIQVCKYLHPVFRIQLLRLRIYAMGNLRESFHEKDDSGSDFKLHLSHIIRNITGKENKFLTENSFDATDDLRNIFSAIVKHLKEEPELITRICEDKKSTEENKLLLVKRTFHPLTTATQWILEEQESKESTLEELYKDLTKCFDLKSLNDMVVTIKKILGKCETYIAHSEEKKQIEANQVGINIENIELFLYGLKHPPILSDDEKNELRMHASEIMKDDLLKRGILMSMSNGDSLITKILPEFKISYLTKHVWKDLVKNFSRRNYDAVKEILKTPDPITELEDILQHNHRITKVKYNWLRRVMKLPDNSEILKLYGKLKDGLQMKVNKLSYLKNRITRLKEILIDEDTEIHQLWEQHKKNKNDSRFHKEMVDYYMKKPELQYSTEILVMNCMELIPENAGDLRKETLLYIGINFHKVLSHGNIILEKICQLVDSDNMAKEIIRHAVRLIEDSDSVQAILILYEQAGNRYENLKTLINFGNADCSDLRMKILKCERYEKYLKLLPDAPKVKQNENNLHL